MANNPEASRTPILSGRSHTSTSVEAISTNVIDTQAFLSQFDGLLTVQVFDDSPAKSRSLSRILHSPSLEQLTSLNAQGAGVFLMVNEGDGQGRKNENVVRVRTFCADFDGAALPGDWPLEPSLIVETSPGKFHAYWFLAAGNDVLLSNDTWNAQQKHIARLVGAQENDATGLCRVMRVPGFLHQKNAPFLSRIVASTGLRYDLTDIQAAFPVPRPQKPTPRQKKPVPASTGRPGTQAETQRRYALRVMNDECTNLATTPEGNRNNALNGTSYRVGRLVGGGHLDPDEAHTALLDAARAAGLPDNRIMPSLDSGFRAGLAQPELLEHVGTRTGERRQSHAVSAPVAPDAEGSPASERRVPDDTPAPLSVQDVLDAMPAKPQLADYHQLVLAHLREQDESYRHHQSWRNWWRYEGGVYAEVPDEVMSQHIDLILQHYGYTVKNSQVNEVIIKIGREPSVGSQQTDQGAWELNTRNGILDLKTGVLRPHTPDYYSIIQSAAGYQPDAVAHQWGAFLAEAVPSESDREILQMYAGLCLTGDISPQRALILVGDGGTGKSTFVAVLEAVLGNLATSSAIENIRDGSFLVGTLVGKRMCVVSELPRRFDWLPFKRITGGDTISVDVKNRTPYTVRLDAKLVILSNVMPFLGDDVANNSLIRRFLPVAFNVRPAQPDPTLLQRLTTADELAGVLNWALEGLTMLRARGMRFPATDTTELTREIVEESNRVITFLREACSYGENASSTAESLYATYRNWCYDTGHKLLSSTSFAKQLVAAGRHFGKPIEKSRRSAGIRYQGVIIGATGAPWETDE